MGYSKKKAIEFLGELESFGLIEKKRRGLGLSNIIYVKSLKKEGFYTTGTMTVVYIIDRINGEGYILI